MPGFAICARSLAIATVVLTGSALTFYRLDGSVLAIAHDQCSSDALSALASAPRLKSRVITTYY